MKKILVDFIWGGFSLICLPQQIQNNSDRIIKSGYELSTPPRPIDPQLIQDQDNMTWAYGRTFSLKVIIP